MKAIAYLLLLLMPASLSAGEGSIAFRDAFRAYVNLRRLEEKSRLTDLRSDLEDGARRTLMRKLDAELTEARIDFQAFLRVGEKELSPWEKSVVRSAGKPRLKGADKTALDFLSFAYGKTARAWTPAEWQCATEWFGSGVSDSFLKITFGMEEVASAPAPAGNTKTLLWINDPFSRYLTKDEAARAKALRDQETAELKHSGFQVQEVDVHPYARPDDQAEELRAELERRFQAGPAILVSSAHASAVLLHTLDLNPQLLARGEIRGWVNVNGKLFGDEEAARAPASISKADRQLVEARRELLPLRAERLERQMPLNPKFPIVNVVSISGKQRPGGNLRDSLVPEGKSLYFQGDDATRAVSGALPYVESHAPSGQRDFSNDSPI